MTPWSYGATAPAQFLAHIADVNAATAQAWLLVGALLIACLVTQHHVVLYGWTAVRQTVRAVVATLITVTMLASSMPGANADFPEPAGGLPDLVSDPPIIRLTKPVLDRDGTPILVLAFDGFLRNIGAGMLDVSGNPQIDGDVQQRVFDGDGWEPVSTPNIIYETNDGHNHFHLVNAATYTLWDDARDRPLETAAKVGFCLADFERTGGTDEPFYGLDRFGYCAVDQSDTTELRMGISPGWRDTYDAATTLQWVDVSNVAPGRYWVSAAIDPDNQIVESDETNNGDVFSTTSFEVPGYRARQLPPAAPGEPITLKAVPYGTVGNVAFVIAEPPAHGQLDAPAMVDLFNPILTYEPEPGFIGTDSFQYYAHDVDSAFPLEPQTITVSIEVTEQSNTSTTPSQRDPAADLFELREDLASATTLPTWQSVATRLAVDAAPNIRWYAHGLPPGLRIDPGTGQITGTPTSAGVFESTIVGRTESGVMSRQVTWTIKTNADALPGLIQLNDFSTPNNLQLNIEVGFVRPETGQVSYVGTGFPLGTTVATDQPRLIGSAQEVGHFDISISRFIDGELAGSITAGWTVRPTTRPAFAI